MEVAFGEFKVLFYLSGEFLAGMTSSPECAVLSTLKLFG